MEDILDIRFKRVETALATLTDSISKYNPNPVHASDLVAADAELSQGLEILTTHQFNNAKILSLRATSSALDYQIRENLVLLTSTRKDLLATPSTTVESNTNPVSYAELLAYARRISKFTLPPRYRESVPSPEPDSGDTGKNTPKEVHILVNGNSTPAAVINRVDEQAHVSGIADIGAVTPVIESAPTSQSTVTKNNDIWTEYLNPCADRQWTPWPSEGTSRRGALASIQVLVDQGVDPATFDPDRSAELEAERKRIVEEEDQKREEDRIRIEEERRKEMERRMSAGGSAPDIPRDQPKVFQLETFDDDDDDD